jgi:hypothetical protein
MSTLSRVRLRNRIDFTPWFFKIILHGIKPFQTINNLEQSWFRVIPPLHIGAYQVILGEELFFGK